MQAYCEAQDALEHIHEKSALDVGLIGWACLHQGMWGSAAQRFEEALQLESRPASYYFLARARAKDQPDYLLDSTMRESVRDLLAQAVVLPNCPEEAFLWLERLQGYGHEEALERQRILEGALAQHPTSAEARLRLATLTRQYRQDPKESLRILEPLLQDDAPLIAALWYAVEAHLALGEHEAALARVAAIPNEAYTQGVGLAKVRGDLLLALGQVDDAIAQYDEEVASADDEAVVIGLFSRAWAKLTNDQVEAAVADVRTALDRHFGGGNLHGFDGPITLYDELYSYPYGDCVRQICTTLLNDASDRPPLPSEVEGRLSYLYYKLDEYGDEDDTQLLKRASELIAASDPARDALDADLTGYYVSAGDLAKAVEVHLEVYLRQFMRAAVSTEPLPEDFATFNPTDYDPAFDPASIHTKTVRKQIHKSALRQLKACQDTNAIQAVFVRFYRSFWRALLYEDQMYKEVVEVTGCLCAGETGATSELFDHAYALHELRHLALAEASYRKYLETDPENAPALHNLSIVLEARGMIEEAAAFSSRAATLAPTNEKMLRQRSALEAKVEEQHTLERRHEEFLRTAPERWPQLDKYKRQLLSTLTVISGFDNMAHLSRLSGIGERYLRGHWQKLVDAGMLIEDASGSWKVNPHIAHLINQERSHAVVATLIHAERTLAVKPIFNSLQEYAIYKMLITLFPNHLVFPNMALQSLFQYERMQVLLSAEEFRYYLMAHVDVCVTSTANYLPIVAFEIDSSYHDRAEQIERDTKKNRIFQLGGVPLVRLRAWGQPTEEAVRQHLIESVRALGDVLAVGGIEVNPLVDVARELDIQRFMLHPQADNDLKTST